MDRYLKVDQTEPVLLSSLKRLAVSEKTYSSLEYVVTDRLPIEDIQLTIHDNGTHILQPEQWYDLRFQNPVVYFAAWGTKEDFQAGKLLPKGSKTKLYTGGSRTNNRAVTISELRPIAELL